MLDTEAHGDGNPADVNALRCRVHRHDTQVGVVTRDAAASLHGHVLVPVYVDVEVDNAISICERTGDVAELAARARAGDVVTQVGKQRRAARIEREVCLRDRRQVVILHLHQLAAVLGEVTALGDDDRHGIAHEAHLVGRKQGELRSGPRPTHESHQRIRPRDGHRFQIRPREHRGHSGQRPRSRDIDREHTSVSQRRAHERSVQHPGQLDVVDVPACAGKDARVLRTLDAGAGVALSRNCCHGCSLAQPSRLRSAASRTPSMMLW